MYVFLEFKYKIYKKNGVYIKTVQGIYSLEIIKMDYICSAIIPCLQFIIEKNLM